MSQTRLTRLFDVPRRDIYHFSRRDDPTGLTSGAAMAGFLGDDRRLERKQCARRWSGLEGRADETIAQVEERENEPFGSVLSAGGSSQIAVLVADPWVIGFVLVYRRSRPVKTGLVQREGFGVFFAERRSSSILN